MYVGSLDTLIKIVEHNGVYLNMAIGVNNVNYWVNISVNIVYVNFFSPISDIIVIGYYYKCSYAEREI